MSFKKKKNHVLWFALLSGVVSVFAGSGAATNSDGNLLAASLTSASALCPGYVVTSNVIRKFTASGFCSCCLF